MTQTEAGWNAVRASLQDTGEGYLVDLPANWKQGRTAYGGLTAALMLAVTAQQFDDLPPLRSALINFVGPVTDSPRLNANLERRGRNVTSISANANIGEKVVGRADFLFGTARASDI